MKKQEQTLENNFDNRCWADMLWKKASQKPVKN